MPKVANTPAPVATPKARADAAALALLRQARTSHDPEAQLAHLLAANAIAHGVDSRHQLRQQWSRLARAEIAESRWATAVVYYEGGIALWRERDLRVPRRAEACADLINECAYCLLQLERLDEASAMCARARAMFEHAKSASGVARVANHASGIAFARGDIAGAAELAREAVELARAANDQAYIAMHLYAYACALFEQGKTREAATVAREGIEIAVQQRSGIEGNLVNMLAAIARENGELDEADSQYARAIAAFEGLRLPIHAAIALSNRANIAFDRGDLAAARRMQTEALAVLTEHRDDRSRAITLTARAGILTELGKFEAAKADLDTAIEILARIGQERRIAFVRHAYARLAEARRDRSEALAHYAETEMSLASVGDQLQIARGLYAQAGVHAELGDTSAAATLLERADAIHAPHAAIADDAHAAAAESTVPRRSHPGDAVAIALRDIALARIAAARGRATGSVALRAEAEATAEKYAAAHATNAELRRTLQHLRTYLAGT